MVKVSVIVPVYNVEKYLRRCLESLVSQTLKEIQIIVVDDGSTDRSSHIIQEFQQKHSQIECYKKENGGLSDARNYGMQYATGTYVAFLDADDYVEPLMYQHMYEKAQKEESDMVECNFYWTYPKKEKKDMGVKYFGAKEMLEKARVVAWNKLYRRDVLQKANVTFPKGLQYEDIEFFYEVIPYIERVSFIKQAMVHYVQRKNSISNTQDKKVGDIFLIWNHILQYYRSKRLYDTYKEELEYNYARILLCSSLKRIVKIKDPIIRKKLLNETWVQLNQNFPNWKQNKILTTNRTPKKWYMLSMNRFTYRIYTALFRSFG